MSNSVDPDYEPSHLALCCLQKPILSPMAVKGGFAGVLVSLLLTTLGAFSHLFSIEDCLRQTFIRILVT